MLTQTRFKNTILLSKNVKKTSQFFSKILSLKLIHLKKNFAELKDHKDFRLIINNASKYGTLINDNT